MGHVLVLDESLVGGVEDDDGLPGVGPVHPLLKLGAGVGRARGVVGGAEVDQVRVQVRCGQGQKAVFSGPQKVNDLSTRHQVGIHVGGIGGLRHQHPGVPGKQVPDGAEIVRRAAGNKDVLGGKAHVPASIVGRHRLPVEVQAHLGQIPVKGLGAALFADGPAQGLDDHGGQRTADVANPQPQKLMLRMCVAVGRDGLGKAGEKEGRRQLAVFCIDPGHISISPSYTVTAGPSMRTAPSVFTVMNRLPPSSWTSTGWFAGQ